MKNSMHHLVPKYFVLGRRILNSSQSSGFYLRIPRYARDSASGPADQPSAGPAGQLAAFKQDILTYCKTNNVTSDKLEQAKTALDGYLECNPNMPDINQFSVDFEAAKENGTVDEVAGRFCAQADVIKTCVAKLYQGLGLCVKLNTETDIPYLINILRRVVNYLCTEEDHKTKVAKFVDEGAMQCFKNRHSEFVHCYSLAPTDLQKAKEGFENLARCMVEQLKECSSAVGTRAQDMFEYIRN